MLSHPPLKERSTNAPCTVPPYKSERKEWNVALNLSVGME